MCVCVGGGGGGGEMLLFLWVLAFAGIFFGPFLKLIIFWGLSKFSAFFNSPISAAHQSNAIKVKTELLLETV